MGVDIAEFRVYKENEDALNDSATSSSCQILVVINEENTPSGLRKYNLLVQS
jgi:hypothetical protein